MDRKAAKALLHIKAWLERVDEITERGEPAYLGDDVLPSRLAGLPSWSVLGSRGGSQERGPV